MHSPWAAVTVAQPVMYLEECKVKITTLVYHNLYQIFFTFRAMLSGGQQKYHTRRKIGLGIVELEVQVVVVVIITERQTIEDVLSLVI